MFAFDAPNHTDVVHFDVEHFVDVQDALLKLHFVWIGGRFPFHARLAVESAIVSMPDAEIHLHLVDGDRTDSDVAALAGHDRVRIARPRLGDLFEDCPYGSGPYLGLIDDLRSPAAISNLIRLAILHRHGGVYVDTDVLLLRALHDPVRHGAYVGQEWVWSSNRRRLEGDWRWPDRARTIPWAISRAMVDVDARLARGRFRAADAVRPGRHHRLQVNNAVIGAPPGSTFVAAALAAALDVDPTIRFALGPSLLDDVARSLPRSVHVLPVSRFYAIPPGQSIRFFADEHVILPADAQLIHYVASNHRRLLAGLRPDDPRFETRRAPFWRRGAEVRRQIEADRRHRPVFRPVLVP